MNPEDLFKDIILGDNYLSYDAALEMPGIPQRTKKQCLDSALKCLKCFPLNNNLESQGINVRDKETFEVNFART
jgi:hypothetical protein